MRRKKDEISPKESGAALLTKRSIFAVKHPDKCPPVSLPIAVGVSSVRFVKQAELLNVRDCIPIGNDLLCT